MLRQLTVTTAVLCGSMTATSADDAPTPQPNTPAAAEVAKQAEMEMFIQLAQPGPEHERMKLMVGRWDCTCRNFESDPQSPLPWTAQAEFKSILGGRYLQQELSGQMPGGIPYAGQGLMGFDNLQRKYVGTWVDNMGTAILHTSGEFDEATHTMTESAVANTPAGDMRFQMMTTHISTDEFRFVMSVDTPMGARKMMEIDYRRRKP